MTVHLPPVEWVPGRCVNCDSGDVTVTMPLYCSSFCKQAATLVRYVRGALADGRAERDDVREAIQMRMAMVLGGGYPERERRVPELTRRVVFELARGKCQNCGRSLDFDGSTGDLDAVATIQHVVGNSSDYENLQAFCRRCNNADAQAKFVPVEPGSDEAEIAAELKERWLAREALRICDDHETWNATWRRYAKEAKAAIEARDELEDAADATDLPGFTGYTDQGTPAQDC